MVMKYDDFRVVRQIAAVLGIVCGVGAILYFALAKPESLKGVCGGVVAGGWTLGPPLWFFAEYWLLEHGEHVERPASEHKEAFLRTIRDYADYASKIWAAVLAILIFIFEARVKH